MEKETFREISRKCVEKLNEYFDTCDDEIGDRYDLNDKIMEVGAEYGITLFDSIWLFSMPASTRTAYPGLFFVISLPLTSTDAANDNSSYILIKAYIRNEYVVRIEIGEDGVDIYSDNHRDIDRVVEEISKI